MTDSFYVVLPSNSTGGVVENTTSKFTVRLPDPLLLEPGWTVALSSIIYPHSFSLLGGNDDEVQYIEVFRKYGQGHESIRVEIPDLSFASIQALESSLNALLLDVWEKELALIGGRKKRSAVGEQQQQLQRVEESEEVKRMVEDLKRRRKPDAPPPVEAQQQQQEKPPTRVEETEEVKQAIRLLKEKKQLQAEAQQEEAKPAATKTLVPVEESEETKEALRVLKEKKQQDGQVTPLPTGPKPQPEEEFTEQDKINIMAMALRAAGRAWQESTELAKRAQSQQVVADHWYTQVRLKYVRKDFEDKDAHTGLPIKARKTPEHLLQWVREQVEIIAQRQTQVSEKVVICVDAAGRAAVAKRETADSVEKKDVQASRKGADRAKFAHRTALDAIRQVDEATAELKQRAEEVIRRVDQAIAEQESPAVPVVLPLPPKSPPPEVKPEPEEAQEFEEVVEEKKQNIPKPVQETAEVIKAIEALKKAKGVAIPTTPKTLTRVTESKEVQEALRKLQQLKTTKKLQTEKPVANVEEYPTADEEEAGLGLSPLLTKNIVPDGKVKEIGVKKKQEVPEPIEWEEEEEGWDEEKEEAEKILPKTSTKKKITVDKVEETDHLDDEPPKYIPEAQALSGILHFLHPNNDDDSEAPLRRYQDYPPAYTKMLLESNREKLSDARYDWVQFKFDTVHQRFSVSMQGSVGFVMLSKQLAYALGFEGQRLHNREVAKYTPDITGGVHQLLVYAPKLVENSIVGNVTAPLLRVVNVHGEPGQTIQDIYATENHHRILGNRHSEISIEIRTLTGRLVRFHWGDCLLTLHFQRNLFQ